LLLRLLGRRYAGRSAAVFSLLDRR
jgi:hypothetical protein